MDLLSNLTSSIKNGYSARKNSIVAQNSKLCVSVLTILYKLGYISNFTIVDKKKINILLKYHNHKSCVKGIARISTSGARRYIRYNQIQKLYRNKDNGFIILSTNKGLLTDEEARLYNIGGELLLKIN